MVGSDEGTRVSGETYYVRFRKHGKELVACAICAFWQRTGAVHQQHTG